MNNRLLDKRYALSKSRQIVRDVAYSARLEERAMRRLNQVFIACLLGIGLMLTFEWAVAAIIFDTIDISSTVSPSILALVVIIVAITAHVLMAYAGQKDLERHLTRLATIGVMVFAVALSMMLGLAAFDGAINTLIQGPGQSGGTFGDVTVDLGPSEPSGVIDVFAALFSPIPPIALAVGMSFALCISFFLVHFLLTKAVECFETYHASEQRWTDLYALTDKWEAVYQEFQKLEAMRQAAIRRLPRDPGRLFANKLYAAICRSLAIMNENVDRAPPGVEDTFSSGLERDRPLPEEINSRDEAIRRIGEIRDSGRPYTLQVIIGSLPPRKDAFS